MTTTSSSKRIVIEAPHIDDGLLRIERIEEDEDVVCILSTGEECRIEAGKLQALCEEVCQLQEPIEARLWRRPEWTELRYLHRRGRVDPLPGEQPEDSLVF